MKISIIQCWYTAQPCCNLQTDLEKTTTNEVNKAEADPIKAKGN